MNGSRSSMLPTLTEEIRLAAATDSPGPAPDVADGAGQAIIVATAEGAHETVDADEGQIAQRVLADLQRQVDLMFEYRMREALAPALARLTDAFLQDMRVEVGSTLRDLVARAVAQELARLRARQT